MRLEKMLLNNVISVRAYNVCKKNNLSNASDIVDYYGKRGTFRDLSHCGNKSNSELIELCEGLEETENTTVTKPVICDLSFFQDLDENDIETINRYIENETKTLSQRSNNAISKYLKNQISVKSLCKHVYGNFDFQVMNLHNVGKGTIEELTAYLDNIEHFMHSVHKKQKVE